MKIQLVGKGISELSPAGDADTAAQAYCYCETPVGILRIEEDQDGITAVRFMDHSSCPKEVGYPGKYLAETEKQLAEYFAGRRKVFDLPLSPKGTEFQKRVWKALCDIPYGETRSYQEIAEVVGNAKATRAVGMANNRNPIVILIPCHRVIGKSGKLTGYAGGLERKQFLLKLEGS